jgi:DNA replication and repair protein RecF
VQVTRASLRDFRNYARAEVELGPSLTVVSGPNGAGKTNLLEAICFACAGRSPRTANEREVVRRGSEGAHVAVETQDEGVTHLLEVGVAPGEGKRVRIDGTPAELGTGGQRPHVSVFLPDHLDLVKGPPGGRRAHVDGLVAALWPARAQTRAAYTRALAQRNALLSRIRSGAASTTGLDAWDRELACHGAQLMENRRTALGLLKPLFSALAGRLGLAGEAELRYRPRSAADQAAGLAAELGERRAADLERGFTAHGPHRDELQLLLDGASLRVYGSQGQQRTAVLALLFAERELLIEQRGRSPLMLLDDVMSELDGARRDLLADLLRTGGQAVVTATEPEHVPGAAQNGTVVVEVRDGGVLAELAADPSLAA